MLCFHNGRTWIGSSKASGQATYHDSQFLLPGVFSEAHSRILEEPGNLGTCRNTKGPTSRVQIPNNGRNMHVAKSVHPRDLGVSPLCITDKGGYRRLTAARSDCQRIVPTPDTQSPWTSPRHIGQVLKTDCIRGRHVVSQKCPTAGYLPAKGAAHFPKPYFFSPSQRPDVRAPS
jgi:hypothetical protein